MFISDSKTFYAFLNFSEETYVKKIENGLRSGLIAINFFLQFLVGSGSVIPALIPTRPKSSGPDPMRIHNPAR